MPYNVVNADADEPKNRKKREAAQKVKDGEQKEEEAKAFGVLDPDFDVTESQKDPPVRRRRSNKPRVDKGGK